MSLFDRPAPRWFTIPAHRPFVEDLARGLLEELGGGGPEALSAALVLTPTRRGARALADGFLKVSGGRPVLLPQIRALGDLDEGEPPFEPGDLALDLPPAIGSWRRRFELARLVVEHAPKLERKLDAAAALELADALAGFLDSCQIEEVDDLGRVDTLVEGDLAAHWALSADFLRVAAEAWPKRLAELGLVDLTQRRVALLDALAEQWDRDPPPGVLVAAGSTGTAPATARLLGVIARAPQGAVVLPGLDKDLADRAWAQVRETSEQHPQGAMLRLLDRHRLTRDDVAEWPTGEAPEARLRGRLRRRVVNEALRPAEATADWRRLIGDLRRESPEQDPIAEGLQGVAVITARHEDEAASAAALLMREALEQPERTVALVTPDQALARRVEARLARWGIVPDSSAGRSLAISPVAALATAVARAAALGPEPATLLAVLKSPLVRFGMADDALWSAARVLERRALRGPAPRDWAEVHASLAKAATREDFGPDYVQRIEGAAALARRLEGVVAGASAPFAGGAAPVPDAARALVQAMETLAASDRGGAGALWAGPDGEQAAALFAALIEEAGGLPEATPSGWASLLEGLLAAETVRAGGATHPRARILGAIEARLVRADRLILAGLEEGVWPRGAPVDPFLSRPMRARLGLPPPERRVGLSAHDFAQAACAPDVILLHSERRGGAPAVKSRWLWRLETLARGAGTALPERPEVLAWARALDRPETFAPAKRPEPRPPVAERPRTLFVTQIERWVRDPYAVYARQVLKLRKLDRPAEPFEAAARGSAIHKALERFTQDWPEDLPENCAEVLREQLVAELASAGMGEIAMVRERTLAGTCAQWLAGFEVRRRGEARLLVEQTGSLTFDAPGGPFAVSAKADRIEVREGRADILDFKTGQAPTASEINAGFAPQLTLTAAILAHGGFAGVEVQPGELGYVRVTGRKPPGQELVRVQAGDSAAAADKALAGLKARVARFDEETTPYVSWAAPKLLSQLGGDYDQLARLWEWHVVGTDEDEAP